MSTIRRWPRSSPQSEIHAAFIVLGLNLDKQSNLLRRSETGQIELVIDLCEYAAVLADMEDIAAATVGGYPGVFEYEVAEPFGQWYGEKLLTQPHADRSVVIDHIRMLVIAFFTDDDASNKTLLIEALAFQYRPRLHTSRLVEMWRRVEKFVDRIFTGNWA